MAAVVEVESHIVSENRNKMGPKTPASRQSSWKLKMGPSNSSNLSNTDFFHFWCELTSV